MQQQMKLGALEVVARSVDELTDAEQLMKRCEGGRDEVCFQGAEAALGELATSEFEAQLKHKKECSHDDSAHRSTRLGVR